MNRDELIAAILPELGKVPMVDAPQSRIREIQAGWIADAILSRLQPSGDGVVEQCEQVHRFIKLPDHPRKDGLSRCPHCMAIGLDAARQELHSVYAKAIEDAARVAYVACAETRHVTLGDKAAAAIRALAGKDEA